MTLHKHLSVNNISLANFPFPRELVMQAYLVDNPNILNFDDDNFSNIDIIGNEVTLTKGRASKGGDGRIDMLGIYGKDQIAVIELKNETLCQKHLDQLNDYLKQKEKIKSIIRKDSKSDVSKDAGFIGILIGTSIDSELRNKIDSNKAKHGDVPVAAITLNRFRGHDGSVYILTDIYFKHPKGRDFTKYRFENKTYGKGQLVLAVITHHVSQNPNITFAELKNAFPNDCQVDVGSKRKSGSVFTTVKEAYSSGTKRHFTNSDQIIRLSDGTHIAVSDQWGVKNIPNFRKYAEKLGYKIVESNN